MGAQIGIKIGPQLRRQRHINGLGILDLIGIESQPVDSVDLDQVLAYDNGRQILETNGAGGEKCDDQAVTVLGMRCMPAVSTTGILSRVKA